MAFFDKIGEKITSTVGGTAGKAKELSEMQKLNTSISQNKAMVSSKLEQMGRIYCEKFGEDGDIEELNTLAAEIKAIEKTIDESETRLAAMKGMKKCDGCGQFIDNSNTFCPLCGAKQAVVVNKCVKCRTVLEAGARFCPKCGTKQPDASSAAEAAPMQPTVETQPAPAVIPAPVPVETPVPQVIPEPAPEEPTPEVIPEPVPEEEPTPEVIPEPVHEEPTPEVIPEPVPEEPTPEVVPEPVPEEEPTPEVVPEAVPEEEPVPETVPETVPVPEVVPAAAPIVPEFIPASSPEGIVREMLRCDNCGARLDDDSAFCPECGSPVKSDKPAGTGKVFCSNCGNAEESGTKFCSQCGSPI